MDEVKFECRIPGRPYIKKNTARHYKFGVVYSKNFKNWEKTAICIVEPLYKETIDYPVHLVVNFDLLNKQAEPDVSNLVEGIQDVLEKCKILKNDRLIYRLTATKFIGNPYSTRVRIYRL